MDRREERRHHAIRKDIPGPETGHLLVKHRNRGQTAAKDDYTRIDQVDYRRQPAGEAVHVTRESRAAMRISAFGCEGDLRCAKALPTMAEMICSEPRAGKEALDTTRSAAVARWARDLIRGRPGQRIMSPFSSDRVGADEDLSPDGDAAPDAGAENDPEYGIDAGSRAVGGFRQGKAIRVVGQARRPPERGLDIALQGAPDQPGGIGVFDEAGFRGDSARNTNPDRSRYANFLFDASDESTMIASIVAR